MTNTPKLKPTAKPEPPRDYAYNNEIAVSFNITKSQYEKFLKWKRDLPEIHGGKIKVDIRFIFVPGQFGTIVKVQRREGEELILLNA